MWELCEAYERDRTKRGVHDFNDVLSPALAEVVRSAERPPYSAVVADDAFDGLRSSGRTCDGCFRERSVVGRGPRSPRQRVHPLGASSARHPVVTGHS
ncbi:hypothetical protein GCM10010357_03830 [Streptomyces luteireticuli]|uniref:Uncharacterized protein n=1 Tax=Streptomyces luteireticuli TaxID=173858 RepID=A0ABP3I019_9ACTN